MERKLVLGIETSCDDTSLCIMSGLPGVGTDQDIEVLSHLSFSQTKMLEKWGGVVPEIAARNHMEKLPILLKAVFKESGVGPEDIDLISVTTHPGLLGPLLTGLNFAKSLSLIYKTPIFAANHLFAHLEAVHIETPLAYPYIGLLISGGHSLYALVHSPTEMELLGSTIDDAAGEAFDKGGKMMGLGYPAGPIIDKLAATGDENFHEFPIGLRKSADSRLSFSGLKTSLRLFLEQKSSDVRDEDICASYQRAIIEALVLKARYAFKDAQEKTGLRDIPFVVGGGVAANKGLRKRFQSVYPNSHFVPLKYCTDNGGMIAHYGLRCWDKQTPHPESLKMDAKNRFISKKKQEIE